MNGSLLKKALLAALTAVFTLTITPNAHCDRIEEFLKAPGVVEKFKKAKGSRAKKTDVGQAPLVVQAQDFALYLNPPKPKPKAPKRGTSTPKAAAPRRPKKVTAKFDLVGTSYFASNPEFSLALISEPAKGLRWVRQSDEIGHLIIEHIKDGLIVVRDGSNTFELTVPQKEKVNLLKEGPAAGTSGSKKVASASQKKITTEPTSPVPQRPDTFAQNDERSVLRQEEIDLMNRFVDKLRSGGSDKIAGGSDEDRDEMMADLISQLQALRISKEESDQLQQLGRQLQQQEEEVNEPDKKPPPSKDSTPKNSSRRGRRPPRRRKK